MKRFYFSILLLFVTNTYYSQWSTDPNANLQVAVHGGNIHAVPDAKGGPIITFNNFDYEVETTYMQVVDKYGYLKWNEPKVIADGPGSMNYARGIFYNNDGSIIMGYISGYILDTNFTQYGFYDPRIQKIDTNGNRLWGEYGIKLNPDSPSQQVYLLLCGDENGGIYAFWSIWPNEPPYYDSLFIQHISKDGERLWGENGIFIADSVSGLNWLINDDNGGFIANYGEELIEKYDSSGILQWSINDRDYREVIKDGYGGIIVSDIKSTFPRQIIINRISTEGEKLWGQEGISVDDSVDNSPPALLLLNFDNTVTVFWDTEWWPNDDLYLQRYTLQGDQVWQEHLKVSEYTSPKGRAGIVQSDNNSNIIVWGETRDSSAMYAQKIDSLGNKLWNSNDIMIMSHSPYGEPKVITDGNGGAIVIWRIDPPWGGIYAQQISKNGNLGEVITSVKEEENIKTMDYYLAQNYPNPFNPSTTIKYVLPEKNFVSLKVYDILGREVKILVNEIKEAGTYSIEFNASKLPSGIYFYTLISGNFITTKKLILLK